MAFGDGVSWKVTWAWRFLFARYYFHAKQACEEQIERCELTIRMASKAIEL